MNYQKLFRRMIGAIWVTLLLVGCGAPGATSDTSNPNMETPLPSERIDLPDLAVRGYWVVFNPGTCGWDGGQIAVSFDNIGEADAGPLTVFIEGQEVRLKGLPAGSSAEACVQYDSVLGGVTALVDSNDEVIESDETNNAIGATHTPPPSCTLTPAPTATMTATPIP